MKIEISRIERPAMSDTPRVPIVVHFSDDDRTTAVRLAEIDVYLDRNEIENKTLEDISDMGLSRAYGFLEEILKSRPDLNHQ